MVWATALKKDLKPLSRSQAYGNGRSKTYWESISSELTLGRLARAVSGRDAVGS